MLDSTPTWLAIVDSLKWIVFVTIIIIVAIVYRKKWIKWLGKSTGIKIDAFGLKFESEQQQNFPIKEEKSLLEKTLTIFTTETMDLFKSFVLKETKYDLLLTDKEKYETLLKYSVSLYIIYKFERIYDLIYGTQIIILQDLNSKGPQTQEIFKFYFDQTREKHPDIFDKAEAEKYAQFLYDFDLITNTKEQRISITFFGRDFLKYLVASGKNIFKEY